MKRGSFFAFINRIGYINRWGLMRNTSYENLKEHSYDVAVIAQGLALIGNAKFNKNYDVNKITVGAMFHDVNEALTGDLPTPVKYANDEIESAYKKIEDQAVQNILDMQDDLIKDHYIGYFNPSKEDRKIIKAADKISALIKCQEEKDKGNNDFNRAYEATKKSIEKSDLEEVKYFMEHMMPFYSLNLDDFLE
jgi:5'-deoxynucleotidase